MKFVRVKYHGRYTQSTGNYLWLNLDNVISVDENNRGVQCVGDATNYYVIDEESMFSLLLTLKEVPRNDHT